MKRSERQQLAQETVLILRQGFYTTASGERVEVHESLEACLRETQYHTPAAAARLAQRLEATTPPEREPWIEVVNETTLRGIAVLHAEGAPHVGALNFASAKNPGGGFLNGSEAQEESLARSSALYASQQQVPSFYEEHRRSSSLLYSDAVIVSPWCPILRDDDGSLRGRLLPATFLTCAAPNAGAMRDHRADQRDAIGETLGRRIGCVLGAALNAGIDSLVLGAWGCGVFRNDPAQVAQHFADWLVRRRVARHFRRVRFSILDRSADEAMVEAFRTALQAD
jgi:uncharacterized protein (TIGR02452 family)